MPTPAEYRKQFIKAFESLAHHRERHDVLADFLEMAVCAIRKRTLPHGPAADAIEAQYMDVVKRNKVEDVRAMPRLLGLRGIPATVRRGNSLEMFDQAVTPAFLPFYLTHREAFDAWRRGTTAAISDQATEQDESATGSGRPQSPSRPTSPPATHRGQLSLFDDPPAPRR